MAAVRALVVALVSVGLAAGVAWVAHSHVLTWGGLPVTLAAVLVAFGVNWVAFVPAALAGRSAIMTRSGR